MKLKSVVVVGIGCALLAGCRQEAQAPSLSELKPKPLPVLVDRAEKTFEVESAPVWGEALPDPAVRIAFEGPRVTIGGTPFDAEAADAAKRLRAQVGEDRPVLLVPDSETFLVQAAAVLAALEDAGIETWLLHPEGKVAFKVTLRDEPGFQAWLDDVAPGKIRMVHRGDGYELQTAVGKLAGPDPNGPTVPLRGGHWDVARLRASLQSLKGRFSQAEDTCIVPSFGMELQATARALTAYYAEPGEGIFDELCLVYPRPVVNPPDGGR